MRRSLRHYHIRYRTLTDRNIKRQASLSVSSFAQISGVYDSKRRRVHKHRFDPSRRIAISQGGVCEALKRALPVPLPTELDVERAQILVQILM